LLNGDLEAHLDTWPERRCPDVVAELAQHTKEMASDILQNATIQLLKWNSNVPELEDKSQRKQRRADTNNASPYAENYFKKACK
ncbi:Hypothetical predicted protein, partial [Paramuricea clavata]